MPRVAIIGAGVSGLATAYYLRKRGIGAVLVEKSGRAGGLLKTDLIEGCRLEAGPDSYISAKPAATKLAQELGLAVIGSNDKERRVSIVRSGKLVTFPPGMVMMVPGRWLPALRSELFSFRTKLRFVSELRCAPRERTHDISVGEFVRDHFGAEVLEYVVEPLLSGVYGGSATALSAQSVLPRFIGYERTEGSLIRAVRQTEKPQASGSLFLSFKEGMQSLTDALAEHAEPEWIFNGAAEVRRTGREWIVQAGNRELAAEHLVLACPAYASGALIKGVDEDLAALLNGIPYSSAILVTFVYGSEQLEHAPGGFGLLVPARERRTVAAATFVNVKFPSRVAPGLFAVRAFIVGAEAEELSRAPDSDLLRLVEEDLSRLLGLGAQPRFTAIYRWPRSMPQYVVGHQERVQKIEKAVLRHKGLHLAGNAYDGVGVPDCIRIAERVATRIVETREY